MKGLLATLVGMSIVLAAGFASGWRVHDWRDSAGQVKGVERVVRVVTAQGAVNTAAAQHDQAAQDRIVTVTRTITREVPVYVTPAADVRFALPVGLLRVHDAAALGVDVSAVPDPAGEPDDAASGVPPSDLARAISDNYGASRADDQQLSDLEAWIRDQAAAFSRK